MASINKCPYCGKELSSSQLKCPNCGAANEYYIVPTRGLDLRPKSIEELKEYCEARRLPLKELRFFIGEDYRKPKAYGIYREGANFVAYKNKADGSRSIRYRGPDEAFAVRELYEKLLEMIQLWERSR